MRYQRIKKLVVEVVVVVVVVLCQALCSDKKGEFPVFPRKNLIAYESLGRRLESDRITVTCLLSLSGSKLAT